MYSIQSTVSLQLVNGVQGGLQSTVEVEVYSSLGNSLYCRLSGGVYSRSTVKVYSWSWEFRLL